MDDVRTATKSLLDDHPEWEQELRALLAQQESAPWTFEEIPFDSGQFGEVVARGLVTETDEGYVLADADAIVQALDGVEQPTPSEQRAEDRERLADVLGRVHQARLRIVAVVGLLMLTAVLRSVFGSDRVFRNDAVVLAGNDSYLTYYWVDHLHEGAYQLTSPGTWAAFPAGLWDHDLLGIVLLWMLSSLAGGTEAVPWVLAWYPVVAGVLVGVVVYYVASRLSRDYRIGIAALLFYAATPATVNRTMVGFADTEGFDYLWLTLTIAAVLALATGDEESLVPATRIERLATVTLGISVAAQVLTWRGGPLLLVPLAAYLVFVVLSAYRAEKDLLRPVAPVFGGLAVASVLTLGVHLTFGWLQSYRAVAPLLLLGGGLTTVGCFTVTRRQNLGFRAAVGVFGLLSVVGFALLWILFPPLSAGILEFLNYMGEYTWGSIGETQSIFSASRGTWFGPFFYIGFGFVLGFGTLLAATWLVATRYAPAWLAIVVYSWFFLFLTVVQLRFAGYFGLFNAILAAVGLIYLLSALELARPTDLVPVRSKLDEPLQKLSIPRRQVTLYTVGILVFVLGFGILLLPGFHADLTQDDADYRAASFIEEYSTERGQSYPDNYVFTEWGTNRMHNYVVSGHSHSYHFARHNYDRFLTSSEPDDWYQDLSERTGYVVTVDREEYPAETMQARLHDQYGSGTDETTALKHYRAIYTTTDASRTVFALVPGATVQGTAEANATYTISTTVTLPPDETEITYEQRVQTDDQGEFTFTTPYPGTYDVDGRTVTIDEEAVETGAEIHLSEEES